jgi:hypothetical protein
MVSTSLSYLVDPSFESCFEIRPPRRRIERFFSAFPFLWHHSPLHFLLSDATYDVYCCQNVAKTKYESGDEDKGMAC